MANTSSSAQQPPAAAPWHAQKQQQQTTQLVYPSPEGNSTVNGGNTSGSVYRQTAGNVARGRRARRKHDTPTKQFLRWIVNNQTAVSFNLLALLFLAHSLFSRLRIHTVKFFRLSYYNPNTGQYNIGRDDACLVLFLIVLFTGLRASTMEYILAPYARSRGLYNKKSVTRFSEQAWMIFVYSVFYPLGLYIYCTSPYFLSLEHMWTGWPNREMRGMLKAYVLIQLAFWVQQILVINIEERRKDHWQMLTHHFITVSLIAASYCYRLTPVGNVILVLMDISDFFLPLAKCQKYLGYTNLCDVTFGAFMLSWFVCRHLFYPMICYSVWSQTPRIIPSGCFHGRGSGVEGDAGLPAAAAPMGTLVSPDTLSPLAGAVSSLLPFASLATRNKVAYLFEPLLDSQGSICYNDAVRWTFLTLLLFLQLLIIVWFGMIVQVAIRVVRGNGADDSRSDDEVDTDEDVEYEDDEVNGVRAKAGNGSHRATLEADAPPLEEEVGVEALDLKGWERRTGVKRATSTTTGVSLPGHSDRKELLGRIGCEKQVD
ncbi:longevity-assurance protein [Niveomyces insectorum RCEF 264]|uniref:Longevity-assurance protein n=1 Tax=Niveomyces insectorum RCEF 264 TaxID=1081102 RepID=A0A162JYR7_9HYPO|nr:longevity-assurance protein [Niveomyces insectorum RCEF 264]